MEPMSPPPTSEENTIDIELCQYEAFEVFGEEDPEEKRLARERLAWEQENFRLVYELATHQTYEGCWALEHQVVNTVNGDANQLKQIATLLNTTPEEAERIIATLFVLRFLVLRFLKDRFADSQVLWQSLAQKAEQWLRHLSTTPPLTDPEPVDVVERWHTWFAQQLGA